MSTICDKSDKDPHFHTQIKDYFKGKLLLLCLSGARFNWIQAVHICSKLIILPAPKVQTYLLKLPRWSEIGPNFAPWSLICCHTRTQLGIQLVWIL